METNKTIPVTILTGFLGSGKTTLLNRILKENHGKKIAVIENEFGEVGVDHELVIGADEEIFEMNNGCICCTVRGDLIRILGQLMKRKDKFDYIIVETTGLANPAPVAQTFWVDDEMKEQMSLDAIVTVVDTKHVWLHIEDSSECMEQIAFADIILLNKIDLVNEEQLVELENKIKRMNPQAKLYRTRDADIDMQEILNVKAFDLKAKVEINPGILQEEVPFEWAGIFDLNEYEYSLSLEEGPDPTMDLLMIKSNSFDQKEIENKKKLAVKLFAEAPSVIRREKFVKTNAVLNRVYMDKLTNEYRLRVAEKGLYVMYTQHHPDEFAMKLYQKENQLLPLTSIEFEHTHEHDNAVTSVGIDEEGELDIKKLDVWVSWLLQQKGTDIFRMKGIINIQGSDDRFVFQGVHMLFDGSSDRKWLPNEERKNQMVFIGKNLNREEIMKGFRACVVSSKTLAL